MAAMPRQWVDEYADALNGLQRQVSDALKSALYSLDPDAPDILQTVMELMDDICGWGAESAETMANIFYDGLRQVQKPAAKPYSAESFGTRKPKATYVATAGIMKNGLTELAVQQLAARGAYEAKRAASENMIRNAYYDPARPAWARIPSAGCKCDFCIMLGSRGFEYHSELSAGGGMYHGSKYDHYHAYCKCEVVSVFDDRPEVEGYDPDALHSQWKDMVIDMASERAEKNGTTVDQERKAIMDKYGEAATNAQKKNGKRSNTGGVDTNYYDPKKQPKK